MKRTTLCYIEDRGKWLMLYRNRKPEDPNEGKWLGIGGKIEPGETPDECNAREVMEEVGLRVKNLRYYKSQPWGSARDILMGFFCDVDGATDIRLQEDELKEGIWVRREDIEGQSDDFSLTHEMMMVFKEGREPKA